MKRRNFGKSTLLFIFALLLAAATDTFAAKMSENEATLKEVKKEMAETAEAIRNYSADQRDEAVKKIKKSMDNLDGHIDRLETRLDMEWDKMSRSARKNTQDALMALRKQRNDVAEWFGGLKHSSGDAWEEVKKGFIKSYRALGDAFEKAAGKY